MNKATEAAATYLALEPSSDAMTGNIRYYSNTFKLTAGDFIPRKVSFRISVDEIIVLPFL